MNGRHFGARLHDYTLQGYRTIALENELLRVEVLADKGTDIVAFVHKPSDTDFMWRREVGLQPAGLGAEPRGADEFVFVDQYEGGWQECLPNGGASVRYKGAQLPFHGELLTRPFAVDVIEDRPEVVSVRLSVRTLRMPLVLEKTLTLRSGRAVLEIDERLTNLADEELDIMWGHHPAFGPPFLSPDCVVDVPAGKIAVHSFPEDPDKRFPHGSEFNWPEMTSVRGESIDGSIVPGPESRGSDELCLLDLREGWYALTNRKLEVGFALEWDLEMFPYVWFWQVFGGGSVYPWFGRMFSCALEPWSSYPLFGLEKCIANGTAKKLGPHESVSISLKAIAYTGAQRVARVRNGHVTPA